MPEGPKALHLLSTIEERHCPQAADCCGRFQVEDHVVGAPCGVMDQMASALGQHGKLLALLCRPAEVLG